MKLFIKKDVKVAKNILVGNTCINCHFSRIYLDLLDTKLKCKRKKIVDYNHSCHKWTIEDKYDISVKEHTNSMVHINMLLRELVSVTQEVV